MTCSSYVMAVLHDRVLCGFCARHGGLRNYRPGSVSGSGYSSPNVSTVTDEMR